MIERLTIERLERHARGLGEGGEHLPDRAYGVGPRDQLVYHGGGPIAEGASDSER